MNSLARYVSIALGMFLGGTAAAHTGVPAVPAGLHPIYIGSERVGGYTSKGYVTFDDTMTAPIWRRMPATTGMYVAAYGTPTGKQYALTSAGLWEFSEGGCTYTEAEAQFGPMTLVQVAFDPVGHFLRWVGATASNGKPVLFHSTDGEAWTRVLELPPGIGWRGIKWSPEQPSALGVFRGRESLSLVSLSQDAVVEVLEVLPQELPLDADLLATDTDYQELIFRAPGATESAETLWLCERSDTTTCSLIVDSPDRMFHAVWFEDTSLENLIWMDEVGGRVRVARDGTLVETLNSEGYFGFLPSLGETTWYLKQTPATHAFSLIDSAGDEQNWLAFEDIVVEPCPPKPGEDVMDHPNPFDPDLVEEETDPSGPSSPEDGPVNPGDQASPTEPTTTTETVSSGCASSAPLPLVAALALLMKRRRRRQP